MPRLKVNIKSFQKLNNDSFTSPLGEGICPFLTMRASSLQKLRRQMTICIFLKCVSEFCQRPWEEEKEVWLRHH